MNNIHLPLSDGYLNENRTMNAFETMKLIGLIENLNQSTRSVKMPFDTFNKSMHEDKELYHFYKVIVNRTF